MKRLLNRLLDFLKAAFEVAPLPRQGWNGRPLPEPTARAHASDSTFDDEEFRTLLVSRDATAGGSSPAPTPKPRCDEPDP